MVIEKREFWGDPGLTTARCRRIGRMMAAWMVGRRVGVGEREDWQSLRK